MKTLLPAILWNESQHLLHMLMVSINTAKIRAVAATFRLELPLALKQLIA
jgi:hypothetical protein